MITMPKTIAERRCGSPARTREPHECGEERHEKRVAPPGSSRRWIPRADRTRYVPRGCSSRQHRPRSGVRRRWWRVHVPHGLLPERLRPPRTFPVPAARASAATSAIAVHGIRPSRNAATATSLAPLNTAGAEPPVRPAVVGESRHGKASTIGQLERELRQAGPVDRRRTPRRGERARRARGRSGAACRASTSGRSWRRR